jgi:tripeptidyl-peptidase I
MANGIFLVTLLFAVELLFRAECQSYKTMGSKPQPSMFDAQVDGSKSSLHIFKETAEPLLSHPDVVKGDRVSPSTSHDVIFVVQQKNMDVLERTLHEVSDPSNAKYGNHMTRQEVDDLTLDPESREEVISYLKAAGVTVIPDALAGECILARAEISLWERILKTEFYTYSLTSAADTFVRADEYSIPVGLGNDVESVLNTVQFPHAVVSRPQTRRIGMNAPGVPGHSRFSEMAKSDYWEGYMSPQLINDIYSIYDNSGHPRATQAAFEGWNNYFAPEDLASFQKLFNLPIIPANKTIGDHTVTAQWCLENGIEPCAESNLDMMYMIAMANTPTYFYWSPFPTFGQWLQFLVNNKSLPPLVISISYGSEEKNIGASEQKLFLDNAIKLGAMGVTILSASGDDGVSPAQTRLDAKFCSYMPIWPTTCPYVLSVGATQVKIEFHSGRVICISSYLSSFLLSLKLAEAQYLILIELILLTLLI